MVIQVVEIAATEAVAVGKQTPRVYVPRIHRMLWKEQIHILIGVASHLAWETLVRKYKTRLKGMDKFREHKALIGAYMKAWWWEIISPQLG